jgi:hypothetical protein
MNLNPNVIDLECRAPVLEHQIEIRHAGRAQSKS